MVLAHHAFRHVLSCLTHNVVGQEDKAADKEESAAKTLKELAEAVPSIWTADFGDTDVKIARALAKAREQLTKKFDGREITVVFPVKNVSEGTLADEGLYILQTGAPHFPLSPQWPLWAYPADRADLMPPVPPGDYLSYTTTLAVALTSEQALRIGHSDVLKISGMMKLSIRPGLWAVEHQRVSAKNVTVLSWVSRGAGESAAIEIEKPAISIIDAAGKELVLTGRKGRPKEDSDHPAKNKVARPVDKQRVAAAKLKMAKSMLAINREFTKDHLKQIIEQYPDTEAAKEAKELLEKMGD